MIVNIVKCILKELISYQDQSNSHHSRTVRRTMSHPSIWRDVRQMNVDMRIVAHRPAANMLLAFLLSTSTAVTGPRISELEPIASQLVFANVYCATLATVLSDNAIEPEAISCPSLT